MLFFCSYSQGQQVSLFQSISTKDGLPSNYVFDLSEDENGFLWIGTDKGLAKYDGFRWQLFNTENGLPGNYIHNVNCNGKDGIWLGISTKGLFYYKISTGQINFITNDISNLEVQVNKQGDIFYYTSLADENIKQISGCYVKPQAPFSVIKIFTIPTTEKYYNYALNFDKETIEIIPQNKSLVAPSIKNLLSWKTKLNNLAVTNSLILKKINDSCFINSNELIFLQPDSNFRKTTIYKNYNQYHYAYAQKNNYWSWNEKAGLNAIPKKGSLKHYSEKEGLSSLLVTDFMESKNGNFLISTLGGGINYKLPNGNAQIGTNEKPVRGLSQNGNKIFATYSDKILVLDILKPESLKTYTITDKNIQNIDVEGDDIFIETMNGFSVYNLKGNRLILKARNKIGAGVSSVIKYNNRFLAGSFGNSIFQYDASFNLTLVDTTSMDVSEKIQKLSFGYASYNYEDGLQFVYPSQKINLTIREGLPSNAVYNLHEYKDTIWISTSRGVAAFHNNKIVKTYTYNDGIKGNRCIFSFHDSKGNFWLLTDKFLNKFNGKVFNTITSIAVTDGKDDVAYSCLFNNKTNTLIVGSLKKLFFTNLDNIRESEIAQAPVIASVFYDGFSPSHNENFTIPSNYKILSINFKPINVNPFVKSFLYYKLEGLQENYFELKDSLSVSFAKLRAGNYKLFAKSINADGVESPLVLLSQFSVDVPFWQKNWFYLSNAFLLAIIIIGISNYSQTKKRKALQEKMTLEMHLNRERERISKDLHDHLGTSLVTMIAQVDNVEINLKQSKNREALNKLTQLNDETRNAVNILRETVWAVQENSHSINEFILRLNYFLQRLYNSTNIEWRIEPTETDFQLSPNQVLQLFRMLQEISQNICKHSKAKKVLYQFQNLNQQLIVTVSDDGLGFDTANNFTSNGLKNLQSRVKEIEGEVMLHSKKDSGTSVIIKITI